MGMKKFYDKLLLLLAALILLGGIALYLVNSGKPAEIARPLQAQPADHPYAPVPVPESPEVRAQWPQPVEQSSTWTYDVFTPPKIYIDENGQFTAVPILPPPPPEPFGVYLAELKRDMYRIQIQGYIEEDRSDPSKSLVLLFDQERDVTVRLRQGEKSEASEIELVEFVIERLINAELGKVEVHARATIRDLRRNEEVLLVKDEILYESGVKVLLRSAEDPNFSVELTEPGAQFENAIGRYELKAISIETNSVTVEKFPKPEGDESKIMTLSAGQRPSAEPPAESRRSRSSPPASTSVPAPITEFPF